MTTPALPLRPPHASVAAPAHPPAPLLSLRSQRWLRLFRQVWAWLLCATPLATPLAIPFALLSDPVAALEASPNESTKAASTSAGHLPEPDPTLLARRDGATGPARGARTAPAPTGLPAAVAAALSAAGVPQQAVSMVVMPVQGGGRVRLDHLSDTPRHPASVMKLFTTGVALNVLGPAFTWHTDAALGGPLSAQGRLNGPLYVRGAGDPSLALERVQLMLARWRAAGLQDIAGPIVIDRQAFDVPPHDPAEFDKQAHRPYNAGPDALLLNLQSVILHFGPDAARPGQVRVSMEPELDGVQLDARVVLQPGAACGEWRESLSLRMGPLGAAPSAASSAAWAPVPAAASGSASSWRLAVSGPYPESCKERDWPVLWQGEGPGDHAARLLRKLWQQAGGKLEGGIVAGIWPAQATVWQSWVSPPLGLVVRDINKFSNNVMARQLFLTLGQPNAQAAPPATGPATLARARQVVSEQVLQATRDAQGHSPCEGSALVLDNGSGLSRLERSSARCLARWLQAIWASPMMPEMLASLPVTGLDGTARRMNGLGGRAHIKTGSLDGVAAVAGVVDGDSGQRHVVVGVINHPQADAARPALDALMNWALHDRP